MPFLLLFITIPLVELYFLIQVGGEIGALPTIALSVLTALIGGTLVRLQGIGVLMRVRRTAESGGVPALELMDGVALLFAGFALLLPGFFTDAVGFLLLIPPVRHRLMRRFVHLQPMDGTIDGSYRREERSQIIDGVSRRED